MFKIKIGKLVWYPLQTLKAILVIAGVLGMVWVASSLVEIWTLNLTTDPDYSKWNYFMFLLR